MTVLENLLGLLRRIEAAANRTGRDPALVELVAVTKKASADDILAVARTGKVRHFGENRVQDARSRRRDLEARGLPKGTWRMIGHLQTNKVRPALGLFDTVDSLDSIRLAESLDAELAKAGRTLPVLVQVKLTGKETQSGVPPGGVEGFLRELGRFPRLEVQGLMAIAPGAVSSAAVGPPDAAALRSYFRRMRELAERLFPDPGKRVLSMGMSQDFEVAVEEGSTLVRVGTALFAA